MGKFFAVTIIVIAILSAIPIVRHTWWMAPDISTHGAPIDEQNHFRRGLLVQAGFCLRRVAIDRSGALALDTPLARHVPDDVLDDPHAGAITVRHVLSHTSGLPNWRTADLPLKTYFPPGERFSLRVLSGCNVSWRRSPQTRLMSCCTGWCSSR